MRTTIPVTPEAEIPGEISPRVLQVFVIPAQAGIQWFRQPMPACKRAGMTTQCVGWRESAQARMTTDQEVNMKIEGSNLERRHCGDIDDAVEFINSRPHENFVIYDAT